MDLQSIDAKELADLYRRTVKERDEQLRQMVVTAVGEVASAETFAAEVAVGEAALTQHRTALENALKVGEDFVAEAAAAEAAAAENVTNIASVGEVAAAEAAQFYASVVREVLGGK